MDPITQLTLILLLAFLAEGLTEYFARPILVAVRLANKSPLWLRYIAMLVGVGLSFAYRADLLQMMGYTAVHPAIGITLTGVLIGRGSNYMNELASRFLQPPPRR